MTIDEINKRLEIIEDRLQDTTKYYYYKMYTSGEDKIRLNNIVATLNEMSFDLRQERERLREEA